MGDIAWIFAYLKDNSFYELVVNMGKSSVLPQKRKVSENIECLFLYKFSHISPKLMK